MPRTIIRQIHTKKIFTKKVSVNVTVSTYSRICTTVPSNKAVKTKDSIRTNAIIALAKRVSFSKGFRDNASKKQPKTTPVAKAAILTGNIMKAKTIIFAALTKNT